MLGVSWLANKLFCWEFAWVFIIDCSVSCGCGTLVVPTDIGAVISGVVVVVLVVVVGAISTSVIAISTKPKSCELLFVCELFVETIGTDPGAETEMGSLEVSVVWFIACPFSVLTT